MKKFIFFTIIIFILSGIYSFADEDQVIVIIPEFDIRVNEELINTENSQYPIIYYKSIVYFPMTSDYLTGIGLKLQYSKLEGLKLNSTSNVGSFNQSFLGVNNVLNSKHTAHITSYNIEVNGVEIDNNLEEYPVLTYKNITYFPMTWRFAVEEFGWKIKWDKNTGFEITVNGFINSSSSKEIIEPETETVKNNILTSTEIGELANAVVKIDVFNQNENIGSGSGFFYNNEGGLITNYHVIAGATSIIITTNDKEEHQGIVTVKGFDQEKDIAIIDTDIETNNFLEFANSDEVKLGNEIYTIGSPLGYLNTLSAGIISSIRENDFQVSAPISPGSSGGVLLNEYGKVIGITYAGVTEGENLGFAIPINKVSEVDISKEYTLNELSETSKISDVINFDNGDSYKGEVFNDQFHGYGEYFWADGSTYKGQWKNGMYHGYGTYTWPDSANHSGLWENDNRHGQGKYTWEDGATFEGSWFNDLKHGTGIYIDASGKRFEEEWKYGEFISENELDLTSTITGPLFLFSDELNNVFLGELTTDVNKSDGIYNIKSIYGDISSTYSIWNINGIYGNVKSDYSAFNGTSFSPPLIVNSNGEIVGRLTLNDSISGGILPSELWELLIYLEL